MSSILGFILLMILIEAIGCPMWVVPAFFGWILITTFIVGWFKG